MAKVFRALDVVQGWLLPPFLHEFMSSQHMEHFMRDTVREALNLGHSRHLLREVRLDKLSLLVPVGILQSSSLTHSTSI